MAERDELEMLGRFIRERRKRLGLTQTELGERLGWAEERISVLENGKYGLPSLPQMARLANALEVPFAQLLRQVDIVSTDGAGRDQAETNVQIGSLRERMSVLAERMQVVESRLHTAEAQLGVAQNLQSSVRLQRERMAELLAQCSQ